MKLDISLRFELAQGVLGALLSQGSAAAAAVRDSADPDLERLAQIECEQCRVRALRDALDPLDAAQIDDVIAEYAPQAKRLFAAA